jgi:hypothetical protein
MGKRRATIAKVVAINGDSGFAHRSAAMRGTRELPILFKTAVKVTPSAY